MDPDTDVPDRPSCRPQEHATAVALLTAVGRSAIATLMVQGPNALAAVAALCNVGEPELARKTAGGRLWIGRWNGPNGEPIVVHARSHDSIEINCHGGLVPSQTILNDLAQAAVPTVPWQTLALRNSRSYIETEAMDALTHAQTVRAAAILFDQAQGALTDRLHEVLGQLELARAVEAAATVARLLEFAELGRHLITPWRVALVGRPNVGKSSLLNAIVGYDRAIVHSTAGTTRDLVTATTAIDGWLVEFVDSAGIRTTCDELEAAGVERARDAIARSDRQLVVFDASEAITGEDDIILRLCPNPVLIANKSDMPAAWNSSSLPGRVLHTCARTGDGIAQLLCYLRGSLVPEVPAIGDAVPFTTRQIRLLVNAKRMIEAGDLRGATSSLKELVMYRRAGIPTAKS